MATVYVAHAYSPRQGDMSLARDHAVLTGPVSHGRFRRQAGDALCQPATKFWCLEDTEDDRTVTCRTCLERMRRYGIEYERKDH